MKHMQLVKSVVLFTVTFLGLLPLVQAAKPAFEKVLDDLKAVKLEDVTKDNGTKLGDNMAAVITSIKNFASGKLSQGSDKEMKIALAEFALTKVCYGEIYAMIIDGDLKNKIQQNGFAQATIMQFVKVKLELDAIATAANINKDNVAVADATKITCTFGGDMALKLDLTAAVTEVEKIMGNAKKLVESVTTFQTEHGLNAEALLDLPVTYENAEKAFGTVLDTLIEKCKEALDDQWINQVTIKSDKLLKKQQAEEQQGWSFGNLIPGALKKIFGGQA